MSKNQKVLWIAVGAIAVLALLAAAVLVGLNLGRSDSDESTAEGTAPSTEADQDTNASGPNGYEVEAGSGGSTKAKADGQTPVGYGWHCPAAVQAATNYYSHALSGAENFTLTKKDWDSLIDEINGGLDGGLGPMEDLKKKEGKDDFWPNGEHDDMKITAHPEQGLFRVIECTDGTEATVDIVSATTWPAESDEAMYSGARLYLTWADSDWRLVDVDQKPVDDAFTDANVNDDSFDFRAPPFPVNKDWRTQALNLLGPDWQEYSNAPQ